MRLAWIIASAGAVAWSLPYTGDQDSWWRLWVALAGSLAVWEAISGRWRIATVAGLSGVAVLVKVAAMGAAQNAPMHTLWEGLYGPLTGMAAFWAATMAAARLAPHAAIWLGLCCIAVGLGWFAPAYGLDLVTEVLFLAALLAAWRDPDGRRMVGMVGRFIVFYRSRCGRSAPGRAGGLGRLEKVQE